MTNRYTESGRRSRHTLVTAIYLNSRGFAFALFEGELAPRNWGPIESRGKDKRERIFSRVDEFLSRYKPDVVVLQDTVARRHTSAASQPADQAWTWGILFGLFLVSFFVRSEEPFLRPDLPVLEDGARRRRQGWPSLRARGKPRQCQATP
jgi:hypothetical protein